VNVEVLWTLDLKGLLDLPDQGIPWAAMISGIGFLGLALPQLTFPDGEVVVEAYGGVAPERWMPVFM